MKVYRPGQLGRQGAFVQPGVDHPNADFIGPDGKPILFRVEFVNGAADVPDNLGRYMIDQGDAKASPIILLS